MRALPLRLRLFGAHYRIACRYLPSRLSAVRVAWLFSGVIARRPELAREPTSATPAP